MYQKFSATRNEWCHKCKISSKEFEKQYKKDFSLNAFRETGIDLQRFLGYIEHKANKLSTYTCKAKYINYEIMITLECEINVPAGITMPAGKVYENNRHASWKIWLKLKLGPKNDHMAT